jgi:hypothetical protein
MASQSVKIRIGQLMTLSQTSKTSTRQFVSWPNFSMIFALTD